MYESVNILSLCLYNIKIMLYNKQHHALIKLYKLCAFNVTKFLKEEIMFFHLVDTNTKCTMKNVCIFKLYKQFNIIYKVTL